MPKVTFVNEKKTIEVERGASLRYAALENGIPLYCMWFGLSKVANCHGNGLCWTDRVRVTPSSAVTETTVLEKAMHQFGAFPPVLRKGDPRDRLACQLVVLEDCEVRTRCRMKR